MKNIIKSIVTVVAVTAMIGAYAQKPKAAKTMKCPSCGMAMPMTKSAHTPVAIKTKTGTYYCCASCPSGKAALKAAAPKKK